MLDYNTLNEKVEKQDKINKQIESDIENIKEFDTTLEHVLDVSEENGRVTLKAPNELERPSLTLSGNGIVFTDENGDEKGLGTPVVANPTLVGTEATLEGLEVDGIKYHIEAPNKVYKHIIEYDNTSYKLKGFNCVVYSYSNTPITTFNELLNYIGNGVMAMGAYGSLYNQLIKTIYNDNGHLGISYLNILSDLSFNRGNLNIPDAILTQTIFDSVTELI